MHLFGVARYRRRAGGAVRQHCGALRTQIATSRVGYRLRRHGQQTLEEAVTEPVARAVLVTGTAGMGKSRVRHEFLRHVRERHGQGPLEIWTARGDAMAAGSPFALISQIVRHAAGVREDQPLEMRREKLQESVNKRVPQKRAARVTQFLGELVGARFPDDASVHLRAARQDAMLMGDQMRAAWEDYIDAESAAHPVMIVIEDLHWGDVPSVEVAAG